MFWGSSKWQKMKLSVPDLNMGWSANFCCWKVQSMSNLWRGNILIFQQKKVPGEAVSKEDNYKVFWNVKRPITIDFLWKRRSVKIFSYFQNLSHLINWMTKIYIQASWPTEIEGDQKTLFLILHRGLGKSSTPYRGLLHFTLDPYLVMPIV